MSMSPRGVIRIRIAKAAAGLVAMIGIAVLWGWAFGILALQTVLPHAKKITASTAVCLILAAISLWIAAGPDAARFSRRCLSIAVACSIIFIAALKLIEYQSAMDLGVDTLLFRGAPDPALMAPATAFNFILFGTTLLLLYTRFVELFQILTLFGGSVSWLALSQDLYGGDGLIPLAKMALHIGAALLILNMGILCVRADGRLMKLLTIGGRGKPNPEALTNLVFNAVDAMPEGGTLTLRTRFEAQAGGVDQVSLAVSDTRAGMDPETQRRCLEPFFTTTGERGTGLGLAMVYGIVRRHQADLKIESELGKGSTIRIVFPSMSASGAKQRAATEIVPERRRILVVDDDPLLIKSLRDALESDGHTVVAAPGGKEGIAAFRAAQHDKRFELVITDLGMPYVDGRTVAAAVKAGSPSTPVILLTGWGQRLAAEGGVPPHVDCVLSKPPTLNDLRAALEKLSCAIS